MKDIRHKDNKNGCVPASSTCISWEGNDLPCIGVKKGDCLDKVIYSMAESIDSLNSQLDFSSTDLKCLYDACIACPAPDRTLKSIVKLIVDKICALDAAVAYLLSVPASSSGSTADIVINLPPTLQYTNTSGNLVTQLVVGPATQLVANQVGSLLTSQGAVTSQVSALSAQVTALASSIQPATPIPLVTVPGLMPTNTPYPVDQVVTVLGTSFVALQGITGLPSDLASAITFQPSNLGGLSALSVPGTMSNITGWISNPSNIGASLTDLWITVTDMRAEVVTLKTFNSLTCAGVVVDFLPVISPDGSFINLYFSGYCNIPAGFSDVNSSGSTVTISDQLGTLFHVHVNVCNAASSSSPVKIIVTGTGINTALDMTVQLDSSITNGTLTCSKTIVHTATNPIPKCPIITTVPTQSTIGYSFMPLATSGATYSIQLYNSSGVTLIGTNTHVNPGSLVISSFTGLSSTTPYIIKVYVTINGLPVYNCGQIVVSTL